MQIQRTHASNFGLEQHGIHNVNSVYWNLPAPFLYEQAIRRREARIAQNGPMMVRTGQFTGRAPRDKFIVKEETSQEHIFWGDINRPISTEYFNRLHMRMLSYLEGKDLFVKDCYAGADPRYRLPIRVITEQAWHSLFAHNLFIQPKPEELAYHVPEFTLIDAPNFHAIPEVDGTRSDTFIIVNFGQRLILIGGTHYAGEIKKSIFTIMNYMLPLQGVLSMHCSANMGPDGDVAIFFGLSGTGKTTLSTDPSRILIGDDEHGWSDDGVFNLEGGCYAKVINLSEEDEPEIYSTTERFGTILENVGMDASTGIVDLTDASLTENTRAAYPIDYVPHVNLTGMGGHPRNIIMLTADAFGVMPPIARLTPTQAMYHFLSGYTAKVAGTEKGVSEPQATFSCCFGAPFMILNPIKYASLLKDKIEKHGSKVWLINTGWSGGPYGIGKRIKIAYTRAMVHAILSGSLDDVPTQIDRNFGIHVPLSVPDVPSEVLNPRNTWADKEAYQAQVSKLAGMFSSNEKKFGTDMPEDVRESGPHLIQTI
jgi:phosphoenolpyruvate carboxykinase (ATP)